MAQTKPISLDNLLDNLVNVDNVASYPENNFRQKIQSSYNRASVDPEDYDGWFANNDYNANDTDHKFIRTEERYGQKEWVVMEHIGAGAIVRTWMPFSAPDKPDTETILRIYIDGAQEPAIEGNMMTLFNGQGLVPYPLAHQSLRSAVSFLPIPYAKGCKITTSQRASFFMFSYLEYDKDVEVESFSMESFEAASEKVAKVCELLSEDREAPESVQITQSCKLASGEQRSFKLPKGTRAVDYLSLKLANYADTTLTRKVIVKMEFDGKQTVYSPIGAFFGSGYGVNPYQGWYRKVTEEGEMSCRWSMPYKKSATLTIVNETVNDIEFEMAVNTKKWNWGDNTLYFHAAYHHQDEVPTRPFSDWNYVEIEGRGVYVGDALTIFNPLARWWGEGDEKIWVDDDTYPSMFGTGTEDYYGYSWGGISTDFYHHPFHAQPQCGKYNALNRKSESLEKDTQGYSTETRSRSLDVIPFEKRLKLDMEVWHWKECTMKYSVGTYWYGTYDSSSNRDK